MGSRILQRGKKKIWWYHAYYNGREYRETLETTDKKRAEREQRARDALYQDPHYIAPRKKNPTCEEFWTSYKEWATQHRRARTLEIQELFWNKLIAFTSAVRMGEIRQADIEKFKEHLAATDKETDEAKRKRRQTANNGLKDIQAIWNRGLKQGWITGQNPVKGIERFKLTKCKPTFHTEKQLAKLLEVAQTKGRNIEWSVLLLGWAGLRRNELANLRWENLDFTTKHPVIKIRACEGFAIKTDQERDIPMNKRIYKALFPHRKPEGFVFESGQNSNGKWRCRYDPRKVLEAALKEAGLSTDDPFQKLRRTFGSLLVQHGVSIFKVAQWMGHSVKVCERHYAGLATFDEDINRF